MNRKVQNILNLNRLYGAHINDKWKIQMYCREIEEKEMNRLHCTGPLNIAQSINKHCSHPLHSIHLFFFSSFSFCDSVLNFSVFPFAIYVCGIIMFSYHSFSEPSTDSLCCIATAV